MTKLEQKIDATNFLQKLESKTKTEFKEKKNKIKFAQFLTDLIEDPQPVLRTSYNYIHDAIMSFDSKEIIDCGEILTKYYLFDDFFREGTDRLFGTARPIRDLVNEIRSSANEEGDERLILLRGPPGTAKTTIVDLISSALKYYSKTDEGTIFNFSWHFDRKKFFENKQKDYIGFVKPTENHGCGGNCGGNCNCYNNNNIGFVFNGDCGDDCGGCGGSCGDESSEDPFSKRIIEIPCQINENPLHLIIDRNERKNLLESIIEEQRKKGIHLNVPKKILNGELCYNCRQIYDQLLEKNKGDLKKVLSHVVVERFFLDSDQGLVNVVGQAPADVYQKLRTYANDVAQLFPKMNFVNLFGKWAAANRGMIHFSDIFKSGEDTIHLLDAVEKHRVGVSGITIDIDTLFIATANIQEYDDVRSHKYSGALMDRLKTINVNYIVNATEEEKIYNRNLSKVSETKHIAPHTKEIAALWAVLTRLAKPLLREDSKLSAKQKTFLEKIDPIEKLEIYMGKANYQLNYVNENKKELIDNQFRLELINSTNPFLQSGHSNFEEGNYGISSRTLQDTFKLILEKKECLNPLNLIRKIEQIMREDRDFLRHLKIEDNMRQFSDEKEFEIGDYYDSKKAINFVREHYRKIIAKETKFSIIDFEETKLDEIVIKYTESASFAKQKNAGVFDGKIKDSSSDFEFNESDRILDLQVLDYVEELCNIPNDGKEEFREFVLTDLWEYDDNNPDARNKEKRNYRVACAYLYEMMETALFDQKLEKGLDLDKVLRGLEIYGQEPYEKYDPKVKGQVENLLTKLKDRYDYCPTCSRAIAIYALKEELLTDSDYF